MSYEIVKSISITKDNKVFICCASNNVRPRTFEKFECESLTKLLNEKGRETLDIELLKDYDNGNLQSYGNKPTNKYSRALLVLTHFEEYKRLNDWRNTGIGKDFEEAMEQQKTQQYYDLLRKALKTPLPKDRFVITKNAYDNERVYGKMCKTCIKWQREYNIKKATIYYYQQDAERVKKYFTNSDHWQVINLRQL